jgi:nitrite reductase/ring-hydroxylating ferredoxin subunit
VVRPLHGHKFDLATGSAVGHACGSLTTYPVKVDERGRIGLVMLEEVP